MRGDSTLEKITARVSALGIIVVWCGSLCCQSLGCCQMSWQEGHGHKCVLAWTWHSGLSSAKKKKTFYGQGAGLGKSWTVWIKQQGLSWWCKEVEMLMLKKPKRESPCSGSSWLLSVGTRTVAARAKLKLVLLLLKCVLEIFRVIGGNLDFIQVLFLIESVSSSTI